MRAPSMIVLVALGTAGCGGGCSGASDSPATGSAQRTEASGSEDQPAIEADPGPVPVLRVVGAVDRYDRSVDIRVENHGTEQVELRTGLVLEQQHGDDWEGVSASLKLRDSCEAEASECITLAPGAVYIPPPWTGQLGDAQCRCARCGPAPAGTYRLVVTSCSGAHRVEGEPIVLP